MGKQAVMIPTDSAGNFLFIKDFRIDDKRFFAEYKSTYNQIPFIEVELFLADSDQNFTICGDDGTVLYRFSIAWMQKLLN